MTIPTIFLAALMYVESGGKASVVGPGGELGVLQIKKIMVDDVNRILGRPRYKHEDAIRVPAAVDMLIVFVEHYATEARLGHAPTIKDVALMWHYGPDGYKMEDVDGYWAKVDAAANGGLSGTTSKSVPTPQ